MINYNNKSNVIKKAVNSSAQNILIGGLAESDLPTRENIIRPIIQEAQDEANKIAEDIINTAKSEALKITETTNNELETIKTNAYNEGEQNGFNKGYNDGLEKANEEFKDSLIKIAEILSSIERERKECLEDEEDRVLNFILLLAKKIIHKDLNQEQNDMLPLIQNAISKLETKAKINIMINSQIANKLNEFIPELINSNPGIENLTVTANDNLNTGDFILESNKESLDLRLESQIDKIMHELQD